MDVSSVFSMPGYCYFIALVLQVDASMREAMVAANPWDFYLITSDAGSHTFQRA